jgi:hypothetical protein
VKKRFVLAMGLAAALVTAPAFAERMPAPEGAKAYIIAPTEGSAVSNPVTIRFGLEGMGVAPAGVEKEKTGHHHLLIDIEPSSIDMDNPLPADDNHRHFGGGQTEVTLDLPAGAHKLILLLGDHNHVPHDPPIMSDPITITVE